MQDIIDQFGTPDTVDELGLGVIRDSIADLLFPGTTTIQTRARYFLFVPWIYREIERRKTPSQDVARKARKAEVDLILSLLANGCTEGTIGARAKEKLKRLPSNVYWRGLRLWRVCLFEGSQDEYHESLSQYYELAASAKYDDDGERIEGFTPNWHSGIPNAPEGFPKTANHDLTREEAEYLRERIVTSHPGTMLAFLVDGADDLGVDYPWQLKSLPNMTSDVREIVNHARNFSQLMLGASLVYNLMLSEKAENDDWLKSYKDQLAVWAEELTALRLVLQRWNRVEFRNTVLRGGGHFDQRTDIFVNWWLDHALSSSDLKAVADASEVRERIVAREIGLKGRLARLGLRGVEDYNGAAGAQRISYRWSRVAAIVSDVLTGLAAPEKSKKQSVSNA